MQKQTIGRLMCVIVIAAFSCLLASLTLMAQEGERDAKLGVLSVNNGDVYAADLAFREPSSGTPYLYRFYCNHTPCPLKPGWSYKAHMGGLTIHWILINGQKVEPGLDSFGPNQALKCPPEFNGHWEVHEDGTPFCAVGKKETVHWKGAEGGATDKGNGSPHGPASVRAYWQPTDGKVGYHMDSALYISPDGGSCGEPIYVQGIREIGGQLPPGLSRQHGSDQTGGSTHFEGTPEQPGDWTIQVKLIGLACKSAGLNYEDQEVNIHFHIEGDAPRKVH